jgi:hypothetical protein
MNRRILVFALVLLTAVHCMAVPALAVNWRPYFTLSPNEGRALVTDCTAIIQNAGVPSLNISINEQVIFGWGVNGPIRHEGVTTDNGRSFVELLDVQPPDQADGGFIYLPDGRTRFLVEEPLPDRPPDPRKSRIISWISEDGINWTREDGVRYQPGLADDSISSVPAVLQVADSVWRLYYVADFYHTNGTRTAISTDWGVTWAAESIVNILRNGDGDPYAVHLTNGRVRIYYRRMQPPGGIAYADGDGLVFDTIHIHMLIRDGADLTAFKLDPAVIRFPNGDVACYMGISNSNNPPVMEKIIAARSPASHITGDREALALPALCALGEILPNPFNATTRIVVEVGETAPIDLRLYDLLGRQVAILFEGVLETGRHTVVFDGNGKPSGVYFCCLRSRTVTQTRKMLLLR